VATTPKAIRKIVAPSVEQAWVALEATRGWSYVYDTLELLGAHLFLSHPKRVEAIASPKVKTDTIDQGLLVIGQKLRLCPCLG